MAKITFDGLDEYISKLSKIGVDVEGMCKRAVYPAAGMVIEAIKQDTPVDTGALRDSAALTVYRNDNGYIYTEVVFDGYDDNGHPNAVKARALESGTSKQRKRPFIRPAVNRVKLAAETMIAAEFDKICDEKMNS